MTDPFAEVRDHVSALSDQLLVDMVRVCEESADSSYRETLLVTIDELYRRSPVLRAELDRWADDLEDRRSQADIVLELFS